MGRAFGTIRLSGVRGHAPPENFENLDSRKHVSLILVQILSHFGHFKLFPVNTDKQISQNKAFLMLMFVS